MSDTSRQEKDALVEELLEKPCWLIDVLPVRVPKDSPGQYAAVERHYRSAPQLVRIHQKFADILLKLNCYYDISVASCIGLESFGEWEDNPDPAALAELVMREGQPGAIHILIESEETLIAIDCDDLFMVAYNPSQGVIDLLQVLSAAEGLFFRECPQE